MLVDYKQYHSPSVLRENNDWTANAVSIIHRGNQLSRIEILNVITYARESTMGVCKPLQSYRKLDITRSYYILDFKILKQNAKTLRVSDPSYRTIRTISSMLRIEIHR